MNFALFEINKFSEAKLYDINNVITIIINVC